MSGPNYFRCFGIYIGNWKFYVWRSYPSMSFPRMDINISKSMWLLSSRRDFLTVRTVRTIGARGRIIFRYERALSVCLSIYLYISHVILLSLS